MLSNDDGLCAPLSDMSGSLGPQLTQYREIACFRGPIIIKKVLNINHVGSLFLLRPR